MSMIQSAEIFTPRPSRDPSENLRILQSPLKPKSSSPLKQMLRRQPEDLEDRDDEEIVLVQGDQPRVVEEEEDLVILENVEVDDKPPPRTTFPPTTPKSSSRTRVFSTSNLQQGSSSTISLSASVHQSPVAPPKTPRNRSNLHRAVLMRSVQRAVLKVEMEKEEEQDELEVAGVVMNQDSTDGSDPEERDKIYQPDEDVAMDVTDAGKEPAPKTTPSSWRSSLQAMTNFVRFRSSSPTKDDPSSVTSSLGKVAGTTQEPTDGQADDRDSDSQRSFEENQPLSCPLDRSIASPTKPMGLISAEYSTRGNFVDGPRRVPIEQSWKVKDLVIDPLNSQSEHALPVTPRRKPSEAERRV
jgi:hypothetical protein